MTPYQTLEGLASFTKTLQTVQSAMCCATEKLTADADTEA